VVAVRLKSKARVMVLLVTLLVLSLVLTSRVYASPWHGVDDFKGKGRHGGVILEFQDLNQAMWAVRHIARMRVRAVIDGYGDGTFRPNKPISRIEAITMAVRMKGMREQAEAWEGEMDFGFRDRNSIPRWAWGYAAVALEEGLINPSLSLLQPRKSAARVWVAELLVRALGLGGEAEEMADAELPFRDAHQIPPGMRGFVAVAYSRGLIKGYPNGKFLPNKPITRAEMAALLDRTDDELEAPGEDEGEASGQVLELDLNEGTLLLMTEEGERALGLAEEVVVFTGDEDGDLEDLQVGWWVEVTLNTEGDVVIIEIKEEFETEGTVSAIDRDEGEITILDDASNELTWSLAQEVEVFRGDEETSLDDVEVGDKVELKIQGDLVFEVRLEEPGQDDQEEQVQGVLVSLPAGDEAITLLLDNEQVEEYPLAPEFTVWYGFIEVKLDDLKLGDTLEVFLADGAVTRINLEDREEVEIEGTIVVAVITNGAPDYLRLSLGTGVELTLSVDPDVEVTFEDEPIAFAGIMAGDEVEVTLHGGDVTRIKVEERTVAQ